MGTLAFWILLIALFFGSQRFVYGTKEIETPSLTSPSPLFFLPSVQISVNLWIRRWASQYDVVAEPQNVNLLSFVLAPLQLVPFNASGTHDLLTSVPSKDSTTYYLTVYVLISLAYMVTIAIRMRFESDSARIVSRRFKLTPLPSFPSSASFSTVACERVELFTKIFSRGCKFELFHMKSNLEADPNHTLSFAAFLRGRGSSTQRLRVVSSTECQRTSLKSIRS